MPHGDLIRLTLLSMFVLAAEAGSDGWFSHSGRCYSLLLQVIIVFSRSIRVYQPISGAHKVLKQPINKLPICSRAWASIE